MSCARLGSDGAGPSSMLFLDEVGAKPEGFDPEDGDDGVDIDLDDKPWIIAGLLECLVEKGCRVCWMLPEITCHIELRLLDFLTSRLDRELISHNVRASDLEERVNKVFLKPRDMLGVMEGLRREKVALEVRP